MLLIPFVLVARKRKVKTVLIGAGLSFLASAISCFVIVSILTLGHFGQWATATFGSSGYQAWYYDTGHSYYITDVDFSFIMFFRFIVSVFYFYKVWQLKGRRDALIRYGILGYMNLTAFCVVNEYKLLSGGTSREMALVILFATIIGETTYYLHHHFIKNEGRSISTQLSLVICAAWIVGAVQSEYKFQFFSEKQGTHLDAMGGYVTELGEDLLETSDFLGDARMFATYASAQEVVTNQFQPSGTDYLIHVLGDEQREEYLRIFEDDDFTYAATINDMTYGFWLERANWFFYQSLFENWHPIFANNYETYWERNEADNTDTIYAGKISLRTEESDDRSIKVIVETDKSISGMADVYLDYEVYRGGSKKSKLVFSPMLHEENTGISFCGAEGWDATMLRSIGKEHIPISVLDGYGEVTLTPQPVQSMKLKVNEVSCDRIFQVQFQYLQVDEIQDNGNGYALHIVSGNRAEKIAEEISRIYIDDKPVYIIGIYDGWIIIPKEGIQLDEDALGKGNMFRVE